MAGAEGRGMRSALVLALVVLAGAALLAAGCAHQAAVVPAQKTTISISPDGRGDYRSLARAVQEAPAGSTVILDPGVYHVSDPIVVYRRLQIRGAGAGSTTIELATADVGLGVARQGELTLTGITLRAVPSPDGRVPIDVIQMQGGSLSCLRCRIEGAVRGRVPERTASGTVWHERGGAGVRLVGDARARIDSCAFSHNDQAGVVRERSARVSVIAGAGSRSPQLAAGPHGAPLVAGPRGPTDPSEVSRFTGPLIRSLLQGMRVPGAAVVVVRGRKLLQLAGYGLADVDRREPIDPEHTRFRIASLTKLFTTMAVLQLWERGSLRLNASVGDFVADLAPDPDGARRLTVSDLLVHAAGYDDRWIGLASPSAASAPPLDTYIRNDAPSRILPPGSISSYTNFSMTLAGSVAQRVAGLPYQALIQDRILRPLGMRDTGFSAVSRDLALPYSWNGSFQPLGLTYFNAAPSGQLFSTPADMVRFLLMQLNGGSVDGRRVLKPRTVALMQSQHFANEPQLPGYAYGFAEDIMQARRVLDHTGDFDGYSCKLLLAPGESLGVFIVANAERQELCDRFIERFMEHYYPVDQVFPRPQAPAALREGVAQYLGTYRSVRNPHRTLDRWLSFSPDQELEVTAEPGGLLVIQDARYVQIEPSAFRGLYEDDYVVFSRGADGTIAFAFRGTDAFERLSWYETYTNQRRFVIAFAILLGLVVLAWAVFPLVGLLVKMPSWLRRLLRRQPFALRDPRPARVARFVAGAVAVLDLAFLGTIAGALTQDAVSFGVPGWLTALLVVPLVSIALTAAQTGLAVVAWSRSWWTVTGRTLYSLVAVVAIVFLWFLTYWNLIGFNY